MQNRLSETSSTKEAGLQGFDRRGGERRHLLSATLALGAAAAAATFVVVWQSPVTIAPHSNAAIRSAIVLAVVGGGVFTWWRRPTSRLGPLMLVLGFLYAGGMLSSLPSPALYTVGRLSLAAFAIAYFGLSLSFPYGTTADRLEHRVLVGAAWIVALLWAALLLFSRELPRSYALADCAGTCPRNPFVVAEVGGATLLDVTRFATSAVGVVVALLMLRKLVGASPLRRRGYVLVLASIVAVNLTFVLYGLWEGGHTGSYRAFQIASAAAGLAIPVVLVLAQVYSHVISAWSLGDLVLDSGQPEITLTDLRDRLRDALGDPSLTIKLWDLDRREWVGASGRMSALPGLGPNEVRRPIVFQGKLLGFVTHDALVDDVSGIAQAMAAASVVAFTRRQLLDELSESRRAADLAVEERIRLERDLHDGAVQRALGIQLGLRRALRHTSGATRSDLEQLEAHAAALRIELRELAHGIYPATLLERGVADALAEATMAMGDRVAIEGDVGRLPPRVEHALYFCNLEAIQNVMRHAGPQATAQVRLERADGHVVFEVRDEGVGFESGGDGFGLASMRDRVKAMGGTLDVESARGLGTQVRGILPLE